MSGGGKKTTVGYRYSLGVHMPFCHGPIDKLVRIRVDKRTAWIGESTGGELYIDEPELFGGSSREGGIRGYVDFEQGDTTQTVNTYLQSQQQDDIPAYRGVAAAVLKQVYLGNNPYLKPWEFRAQRIHTSTRGATQWYDAKAEIEATTNTSVSYTETFSAGIDSYTDNTASPGFLSNFFIKSDDYGSALKVTATDNSDGYISKSTYNFSLTSISIKFKVEEYGTDDISFFSLHDSDGNLVFRVNPQREQAVDASQRCQINAPAFGSGIYLSPAKLPLNEWHELTISIDRDALQLNASLVNLSTGSTVGSASGVSISSNLISSETRFYTQGPAISSSGIIVFDDLVLNGFVRYSDMNPAHIIRECLTDTSWGLGYTAADIDDVSFTSAADTLYDEEFGLSFLWTKEVEIEEFVKDVLRHIDAALYVSPSTGKFVLKLIRDDYTIGSLPVFNESNVISIQDYKKPTIGELKNYITVKYYDMGKSEMSSTTPATDPALSIQQGSISSETIQFDGITNGSIASRVAQRTLDELSNPLITCSVITNRDAHSLSIGDAFKLTWPKYGIADVVMRVTNISFGELTDGRIKIDCVQDVFGLPTASYSAPTDSNFNPITSAPEPMVNQLVREADYWSLIQNQGEEFTLQPLDGYLITAGESPTSGSINYRIWSDETGTYEEKEPADFCPVASISESLTKVDDIGDIKTTVAISGLSQADVDDIDIGSMCQINDELMVVETLSTTSLTVGRAVADSVISDHSEGDKIYFYGTEFVGISETLYQDGESINAKLTPSTGQGQLDVTNASALPLTFDQRAYRPYPPGNLQFNGEYFPASNNYAWPVTTTWAHRDRLLQTADLNDFTETSIGPESGVTYSIDIIRTDTGDTIESTTGENGTSYDLTTDFEGEIEYTIKSVRSGLGSLYSQTHIMEISKTDLIKTENQELIITESGEYFATES